MATGFSRIVTFTGKTIDPLRPAPKDICIEDIAHALSFTCRFSGHTCKFYSVSQHCLAVAARMPKNIAIYGLLHDAAEAYLTDIPRPFKHRLRGYKTYETRLLHVIQAAFGLPRPHAIIRSYVKDGDEVELEVEHYELLPDTDYWPKRSYPGNVLSHKTPDEAEREYLEKFSEYRASFTPYPERVPRGTQLSLWGPEQAVQPSPDRLSSNSQDMGSHPWPSSVSVPSSSVHGWDEVIEGFKKPQEG